MITLVQQEEMGGYLVHWSRNGAFLGTFLQDVDGYFYFSPDQSNASGLWASYSLRAIADKLDEINKPWNDQIDEYFKNNPPIDDEVLGQFDPF